jgi:hypothetical protein
MAPRIVTIGVYGWVEEDFFRALVDVRVDLFCDLRARRGVRGSTCACRRAWPSWTSGIFTARSWRRVRRRARRNTPSTGRRGWPNAKGPF